MTAQATPNLTDAHALVVFGRDATGKPHASSFTESEADLATKAAELMGLRLLPVRTDSERALARRPIRLDHRRRIQPQRGSCGTRLA